MEQRADNVTDLVAFSWLQSTPSLLIAQQEVFGFIKNFENKLSNFTRILWTGQNVPTDTPKVNYNIYLEAVTVYTPQDILCSVVLS